MADNKVKVRNRSSRMLIYKIPDMGVRREWQPGEVKNISREELDALSYVPGGTAMLRDSLFIEDADVVKEMPIKVEPEYYLDENGVIDLIQNGTVEAFLDCLDFAPDGVIDLIKKYAYELPCNDARKRDALKAKTGFDVTLALQHKAEVEAAQAEEANTTESGMEVKAAPTRRVQADAKPEGHRTAPKYKVVTKGE